jgi:hypothetical protein
MLTPQPPSGKLLVRRQAHFVSRLAYCDPGSGGCNRFWRGNRVYRPPPLDVVYALERALKLEGPDGP